jgi:glycosyltransferase involved in cell wall biosynthesis
VIGYFGFLSASKGGETLLEAVRSIIDGGRSSRLVLIGARSSQEHPGDCDDEQRTLRRARALNLHSIVHTTGYLSPQDVSAHLLACDIIALPYRDGASFRRGSLLAAMEHRRPIVTTLPSPAAKGRGDRMLEPGRQFLAVPPDDPLALANAVNRLADDRELASRLAEGAGALAARCTWPAITAEMVEVYRSVQ